MSTLPRLDTPEFDHGSVWEHTQPPHPDFTYGRKVEATPDGKKWVEDEVRYHHLMLYAFNTHSFVSFICILPCRSLLHNSLNLAAQKS